MSTRSIWLQPGGNYLPRQTKTPHLSGFFWVQITWPHKEHLFILTLTSEIDNVINDRVHCHYTRVSEFKTQIYAPLESQQCTTQYSVLQQHLTGFFQRSFFYEAHLNFEIIPRNYSINIITSSMISIISYRGYPTKRALPAMLTHGR